VFQKSVGNVVQHLSGYEQYFAMARGVEGTVALDMSKFFDTNYHYMVPELDSTSKPTADWSKLIEKVNHNFAHSRVVLGIAHSKQHSDWHFCALLCTSPGRGSWPDGAVLVHVTILGDLEKDSMQVRHLTQR